MRKPGKILVLRKKVILLRLYERIGWKRREVFFITWGGDTKIIERMRGG